MRTKLDAREKHQKIISFIKEYGEIDIIFCMLQMLDESINDEHIPLWKFKAAESLEDAYDYYTKLEDDDEN